MTHLIDLPEDVAQRAAMLVAFPGRAGVSRHIP